MMIACSLQRLLSDYLYRVSFQIHSPLSLEVVEKNEQMYKVYV